MAETITFEVELHAFGEQGREIRPVDVPAKEAMLAILSPHEPGQPGILGPIFQYGQNDFQPKPFRSVSVGDIIRLHPKGAAEERYVVKGIGFERVPEGWVTPTFAHGTEPDGSPHLVAEGEWAWGLPGCEDLKRKVEAALAAMEDQKS